MNHRSFCRPALVGLMFIATSLPASAHVGHGDTSGALHGFLHPIGGMDHMLAMVAVGILAALMGRRAIWALPVSFMLMMAAGAVLAMNQIHLPFVEIGISASVIALGLAIALQLPMPLIVAMGVAGFFALFHGYAHGAEMPIDTSGAGYAAGFLAATALLHVAGIALGLGAIRMTSTRQAISRVAGSAIAIAGIVLTV